MITWCKLRVHADLSSMGQIRMMRSAMAAQAERTVILTASKVRPVWFLHFISSDADAAGIGKHGPNSDSVLDFDSQVFVFHSNRPKCTYNPRQKLWTSVATEKHAIVWETDFMQGNQEKSYSSHSLDPQQTVLDSASRSCQGRLVL